jgi:hypothetical protein
MGLADFMTWLEEQALSIAIAESSWMFPTLESLHVLALALVFGSIAMLDLRLMGVARKNTSVTQLTAEMLPWTWCAFTVAAITGLLLFSSSASRYATNLPFLWKMGLLALAGFNMAVFHLTTYRAVAHWDRMQLPLAARVAGFASISMWTAIIFLGRWIGFV